MIRLLLLLFVLLIVVLTGVVVGHSNAHLPLSRTAGWALATVFFGMLAGLSEILSRYRDEPVLACATSAGAAYLALNGVVSLAAFMVLRMYPEKIFPDLRNDLFLSSVVAGFGAMVIFRSKLFTFRSPDGKDYSIGPAIVLETVLRTIDSKIDRQRATERQTRVFEAVKGLTNFGSAADYIDASLLSFQNLSTEDRTEIANVIQQYREVSHWPDSLKILGLGFAFLNLAGDTNFDRVMVNLKQFVQSQTPTPPGPAAPASNS